MCGLGYLSESERENLPNLAKMQMDQSGANAMFSLVTACMNREAHLRRSLQHWLKMSSVREVVVVDWSNPSPLVELADLDSRIRVIRVEGERRWILSYAYNLGVSRASHELILKCDADCLPEKAVEECCPGVDFFFAGHWKSGSAVGKPSVNGQCVVAKRQFEEVNGYSEIIRSYGRDDEDFYDRLISAGFARREIGPDDFAFLPHSDNDRIRSQVEEKPATTIDDFLERNLTFQEMRNFFLGRQMPWGRWFVRASYQCESKGERYEIVRRNQAGEIPVPPALAEAARLFGLRYLIGTLWGLPPTVWEKLEEKACLNLLVEKLQGAKRGDDGSR